MNIKDIHINPHNPRYIRDERYQQLKKSIKEFPKMMKLRPIIVENDGMILGGNMRYLAMIDLGYEEIPEGWVVKASELTEEEQRKFKIVDNIPFGDWDYDILANEWDFEELKGWGMEFPEIEMDVEAGEDGFDVDKAVKEVGKPTSKEGDIWQLGEHRLMCGDSRKKEDVERLMDGKKADMIFTDPPYGIDYSGGRTQIVRNKEYGKIRGDKEPDVSQFVEAIVRNDYKQDCYVCMSPINLKPMFKIIDKYEGIIVWKKQTPGLGYQFIRRYCEFIFFFSKRNKLKFDKSEFDFWEINTDDKTEYQHGNQKPIALPHRAISFSSKEYDLVCDWFGGAGSTLIACEQLKRICYMMEIDPVYIDVIIERWENYTGKKAVKISGESKIQGYQDSNK